jgi:phage tail-like protein
LQTWNFTYAYPVKWSLSGFNATANSVVVESIELAYKKFTVT